MEFKELRRNWELYGKKDPMYAILSWPGKEGNKWDSQEFFRTGKSEIQLVFEYLKTKNIALHLGRALDFGCGVGRLTQALCEYFSWTVGIDISSSMIELARKYNAFGNKCSYEVNVKDDLSIFESNYFDFIYSNITLQHMRPDYAKKYITEFIRVLKPGGVLLFQIPSHKKAAVGEETTKPHRSRFPFVPLIVKKLIYKLFLERNDPKMEMYGIEPEEVKKEINLSGGKVLEVTEDSSVDDWHSLRYLVTK